jgi:hypothetical protein
MQRLNLFNQFAMKNVILICSFIEQIVYSMHIYSLKISPFFCHLSRLKICSKRWRVSVEKMLFWMRETAFCEIKLLLHSGNRAKLGGGWRK